MGDMSAGGERSSSPDLSAGGERPSSPDMFSQASSVGAQRLIDDPNPQLTPTAFSDTMPRRNRRFDPNSSIPGSENRSHRDVIVHVTKEYLSKHQVFFMLQRISFYFDHFSVSWKRLISRKWPGSSKT